MDHLDSTGTSGGSKDSGFSERGPGAGAPDGNTRVGPQRCAFEDHVELSAATAGRVRAGINALARSLATCGPASGAIATGPLSSGIFALGGDAVESIGVWLAATDRRLAAMEGVPGSAVRLAREEGLDLAAALLEIADALFRAELTVEALALEGIESYLIGALVTPVGPGR